MAAESFKKMTIYEGITLMDNGEMPYCSETDCDKKAAYKIECGNALAYTCEDHLDDAKTRITEDDSIDEDARVCSQDGPNDLERNTLNTPAF